MPRSRTNITTMIKLCLSVLLICVGMSMVFGNPMERLRTENILQRVKRGPDEIDGSFIVNIHDNDGDGKLDRAEIKVMSHLRDTPEDNEYLAEVMTYDTDKDGKIDPTELETAHRLMWQE